MSQDIYLIDDTIKRNIVIGLRDNQINKQKLYDSIKNLELIL